MSQAPLHLLFHLGGGAYALDACDVLAVLPRQRLKQLPGSPPWVVGLFMREGAPVPVIDLGLRAFDTPAAARSSTRLVLVNFRPAAEGPPRVLGLLLEQATDTLRLELAALRDTGLSSSAPWLGQVHQGHGRLGMVQRIRVGELLTPALSRQLFADFEASSAS